MKLLSAAFSLLFGAGAAHAAAPAPMPEFAGIEAWLNTPAPLTVAGLKGQVVLVEFWTAACGNCINTLPHVRRWHERYKGRGLVVVGVHTPESGFERKLSTVRAAAVKYGLEYPIALDNDFATWKAYSNRYWPTLYLVDRRGVIRGVFIGEGRVEEIERAIEGLLGKASA